MSGLLALLCIGILIHDVYVNTLIINIKDSNTRNKPSNAMTMFHCL